MPRNGSGTYSLPQPAFVAGTVISSAAVNSDLSDIASALTGSLPRDGQAGMTGQLKLPDGSTGAPSVSFTNELTTGFSRATTGTMSVNILGVQIATITSAGWNGPVQAGVPIGTVVDFASSTSAPPQWIQCYGQAISRTTYTLLFAIIGTTYGVGDGSTTFNLPDLRGFATIGLNTMGGPASGRVPATYDTIGGNGGGQNTALSVGQIPNITSSANNNISVSINSGPLNTGTIPAVLPGFAVSGQDTFGTGSSGSFAPVAGSGGWGGVTSLANSSQSITVQSQSTGAGTPVPIIQPSFALVKIIYAGA